MLKFRIYALTIWHIVWYSSFPMSFLVLFYYIYKNENQNNYIRAVRTWNMSVCVLYITVNVPTEIICHVSIPAKYIFC